MKTHARVVIIGGGSLGVSLLYHLAKEGWTDTALIEKGELTSGSTWHAAGLCPNFNGNMAISQIQQYTMELYEDILPKETGEPSNFRKTGSLRVGFTELEDQWFRNMASKAKKIGFEYNFISKEEAKELNPLMSFDDAYSIVHTPNDGHVDPTSVVMPIAKLAREMGADIYRHTRVTDIQQLPSKEWEVTMVKDGAEHKIIAEHVVNAAGCFAKEVGAMVGAHIPMVNLEHQYLVTEGHPEIAKLTKDFPVCRDSYTQSYIRHEGDGLLIGPYETFGAKPWALEGMDWNFDRGLFPAELERIMPFLERCMDIMPVFSEVGIQTVINGPIAHTPDDNPLVGPAAGLHNFWNLCASSIGIAQGGIGKYMAQWMMHGQTEINMTSLDSRRFGKWADTEFCRIKAIESYENMYTPFAPNDNRPHARPARRSPLYTQLNDEGCIHAVVNGYEKPRWFRTAEVQSETLGWGHTEAHQVVAEECAAVRDAAGINDLSGASKFSVKGPDAMAYLNNLSANKLPARDGRMGLTLLHGPNGGILAELSVTRITEEEFYLNGGIVSDLRDFDWLQRNIGDYNVTVDNLTDSHGVMLVTGPKSREILQELTEDDLSHAAFPWLSTQDITIESAPARVLRVSYAGELGYEIHMPTYLIPSIYESIMRVGKPKGLRNFGMYAFNSMRMEKAYAAYGHEYTEELNGLEAGAERFTDLSRDFMGADALRKTKEEGCKEKIAYLVFDDNLPSEVFVDEAVFHNGEYAGAITSGAYGHRVGKSLAFAYIAADLAVEGTKLTVETSLGMREAHVEMNAVYDPKNERMRC